MKSEVTSKMRDIIRKTGETWQVPNITYALIANNEVIEVNSCVLDSHFPTDTLNKVFRIGSNSKAMACMILNTLEEQRRVSLNEPVINYLPDFKMYTEKLTKQVTIRDLVTHSTGISKYTSSLMCYLDYPSEWIVNGISHFKPVKQYHSSFQYHNGMYVIAGKLIEKITGIDNATYFRNQLFEPLSMHDTHTSLDALYEPTIAVPHVNENGISFAISQSPFGKALSVGGNVNTTITDLVQWLLFNLKIANGTDEDHAYGKKIFEPCINISQPKSPTLFGEHVKTDAYCMGWYRAQIGKHTIFEHMGGFSGYMSNISFCPNLGAGIILLTNRSDIWYPLEALRLNFYQLLMTDDSTNFTSKILKQEKTFNNALADKFNKFKQCVLPIQLNNYRNIYHNPVYGDIKIQANNDTCFLKIGPKELTIPLNYLGSNRFKFIDEHLNFGGMFKHITFTISENHQEAQLEIYMDNQHGDLAWVDTQKFILKDA